MIRTDSVFVVKPVIDRMIHGTASILIAHHLATMMRANRIVVVNLGAVETVDCHAELLSGNETYGPLSRLQSTEADARGNL